MTETEKLLHALIALPSVNPAFLPPNDPHAGEKRVADYLEHAAKKFGLDVRRERVLPQRDNLLVTLPPTGKLKQRILLAPHLDTINVSSPDGFRPRSGNGRIHGRGACDTKGSVAAMFIALTTLARNGPILANTEILFVGLIDEESEQAGSRALAKSGLKVDLAIVGEPTKLKIVTAHKGSLWLRLETRGKAAHGACPHLGKNAVHEMARIVDLLETKYAAQLRRRRHPLLGHGTINVGTFNGGTQPNIVPAACVANADRRTLPGETEASVQAEITALLRPLGLRATISDEKSASCIPLDTDFHLPLVQKFFRAAGQTRPVGVDFFCDASILAQGGIPSIVFGPGDIAQAHADDEWISLKSLEGATTLLLKFLRALP